LLAKLSIACNDSLLNLKAFTSNLKPLNINLAGVTMCVEKHNNQLLDGTFTTLFLRAGKCALLKKIELHKAKLRANLNLMEVLHLLIQ